LSSLLSRHAEAIFWMARQVERVENLARLIDVNETFSRDSRGSHDWRTLLLLYADMERFAARGEEPTAENVLRFYLLDRENPTSIMSSLAAARENARTLRPLISTEMWVHINVFYNQTRNLKRQTWNEENLSRLCATLKENCQTHRGILEGTFFRDEGWFFYHLGKDLERADQMTRLVDVKYHLLLPQSAPVGSPVDVSQWNALLRSAAAYHAYRRIYPSGMTPARVAGFLLLNGSFPRSARASVDEAHWMLTRLRKRHRIRLGQDTADRLAQFHERLRRDRIERLIERGLHEQIDGMQMELIRISNALGREFFGHADEAPYGGMA